VREEESSVETEENKNAEYECLPAPSSIRHGMLLGRPPSCARMLLTNALACSESEL
jgi:hypothetical protein